MKKIIFIQALMILLVLISGCSTAKGVETKSTIVNKEENMATRITFM